MLQFCNIYNIVSKYSNFLSYGFVISKWMILSSLYVYELIYTTWSLCSFRKSKFLLETVVICRTVLYVKIIIAEKFYSWREGEKSFEVIFCMNNWWIMFFFPNPWSLVIGIVLYWDLGLKSWIVDQKMNTIFLCRK